MAVRKQAKLPGSQGESRPHLSRTGASSLPEERFRERRGSIAGGRGSVSTVFLGIRVSAPGEDAPAPQGRKSPARSRRERSLPKTASTSEGVRRSGRGRSPQQWRAHNERKAPLPQSSERDTQESTRPKNQGKGHRGGKKS